MLVIERIISRITTVADTSTTGQIWDSLFIACEGGGEIRHLSSVDCNKLLLKAG